MKLDYKNVLKVLAAGIFLLALVININVSVNKPFATLSDLVLKANAQNEATTSTTSVSSNNNDSTATVRLKRQTSYNCIYYILGIKGGCENCAYKCEPKDYLVSDKMSSNCTEDKSCCAADPVWSALYGPCTTAVSN